MMAMLSAMPTLLVVERIPVLGWFAVDSISHEHTPSFGWFSIISLYYFRLPYLVSTFVNNNSFAMVDYGGRVKWRLDAATYDYDI